MVKNYKKHKNIVVALLLAISMMTVTSCGKKQDEPIPQPETVEEEVTETVVEEEPEVDEEVVEEEPEEIEEELPQNPPIIDVINSYEQIYSDDGEYVYAEITLAKPVVLNDGYDELKAAIDEKDYLSTNDSISWFKESVAEYATPENLNEYEYSTMPWFLTNTINIKRSDSQILSFQTAESSFLGGVHPFTSYYGTTFDAQTGDELLLKDVITNMDDFTTALYDNLDNHEYQSEFYPEYKDTVQMYLDVDTDVIDPVQWYLTQDALVVTYDPYVLSYYALGAVSVRFPYADYPDLFNEMYVPEPAKVCVPMFGKGEVGGSVVIDLDGDGELERVVLNIDQQYEEYDGNWYVDHATPTVEICKGNESKTLTLEEALDTGMAYIIESDDGHYYMYIEYCEPNDWRSLKIVDITDFEEGPVDKGFNESGAFYGMTPTDADYICVQTRLYIMGTYTGYTACHIGRNGQLVADDDVLHILSYSDEGYWLTTLQDFKAYKYNAVDMRDKRVYVTIPTGSKLRPYATDGGTYMTFLMEDGNYVDVYYDEEEDPESWEHTIGGMPESEVLDGIIYAG